MEALEIGRGREGEEEESTSEKVDFSGKENQAAEKHAAGDIRVFTHFSPFCSQKQVQVRNLILMEKRMWLQRKTPGSAFMLVEDS